MGFFDPAFTRDCKIAAAHEEYERTIAARAASEKGLAESVTLHDHYSATISLRIAEIQPQHGLVQLNARRDASNELISCDVDRDRFIAAVEKVLNVTVTTNKTSTQPPRVEAEDAVSAETRPGRDSARPAAVGGGE